MVRVRVRGGVRVRVGVSSRARVRVRVSSMDRVSSRVNLQVLLHAQDDSKHCTPVPQVAGMCLSHGKKPDWPDVSWQ